MSFARRITIKYLEKARKILPHPLWGIAVATLIAFSGRGELLLRSIGMCLVVIWLALDLWAWLLSKRAGWKWIWVLGANSTSLMLIAVRLCMWWWMDGKLKDQQDDVSKHLEVQVRPPGNGKLFDVLFTLFNRSEFDVERRTAICFLVFERYENDYILDHTGRVFSDDRVIIRHGGDSDTIMCSQAITVKNPLVCAGLIVQFS
jgi:hypothetical protein